jgi:hypothetical protein
MTPDEKDLLAKLESALPALRKEHGPNNGRAIMRALLQICAAHDTTLGAPTITRFYPMVVEEFELWPPGRDEQCQHCGRPGDEYSLCIETGCCRDCLDAGR